VAETIALTIDRKARIRAFRRLFLGIVWDLYREARLTRRLGIRDARRKMSARHRRRAIQFRETAGQMGGVVIKLGQFLSARADVMPEEYLQELSKLQDEVPPVPFDAIRGVIEEEFGKPLQQVYRQFDAEPLAAASLGQVHAAVLTDGTRVAVKVQRPGIRELVDVDMATFAWLMDGAHRLTRFGRRFDIPGLVDEFARTLSDELDFYREGTHAERFCEDFARNPIIEVPDVFWDYTTDRVLTLERIDGIKISDYEALEAAGVDRSVVADEVFQSYMQQILVDGFFHADPHPGNLFVVTQGGPTRITFVDFGMVGEITDQEREQFKHAVIAGSARDLDDLVASLSRLGFIRPGANVDPIKRAIAWIFEHYSGITAHRVSYEELESIQEDIRTLVYEHPFTLPSQFGFLGRAVGTMIGLVSGLDPHYDFVSAVKPYVRRATTGDPAFVIRQVRERVVRVGTALLDLPERVEKLLELAERGELNVRTQPLSGAAAREQAAWGRLVIAFSIWAVGLLGAGVVFFVMGLVDWAVPFWAVSLLVMVIIALPERRRRG
jgi:predicted unusual protein kinase regulating ubiquinone biosynthesis (AarF/ABC1/UbiB family)